MGSRKEQKPPGTSLKNPKHNRNPLKPKKPHTKTKKKNKDDLSKNKDDSGNHQNNKTNVNVNFQPLSAPEQLLFFVDQFQSFEGVKLSSLELESINDKCILGLPRDSNLDVKKMANDIKAAFGASWKEKLYEGKLSEGIEPGCPAILAIGSSAIRSLDLLRGFHSLTRECRAAKLFSKHMKVEEQASLLKNRVNIASGTPSRIKKLIEMEALGLSRLQVLVLDMHLDVKGYSLFSLPQVRDEFWDLFKTYLYPLFIKGDLRICLYGPCQYAVRSKGKQGPPKQ